MKKKIKGVALFALSISQSLGCAMILWIVINDLAIGRSEGWRLFADISCGASFAFMAMFSAIGYALWGRAVLIGEA